MCIAAHALVGTPAQQRYQTNEQTHDHPPWFAWIQSRICRQLWPSASVPASALRSSSWRDWTAAPRTIGPALRMALITRGVAYEIAAFRPLRNSSPTLRHPPPTPRLMRPKELSDAPPANPDAIGMTWR